MTYIDKKKREVGVSRRAFCRLLLLSGAYFSLFCDMKHHKPVWVLPIPEPVVILVVVMLMCRRINMISSF